MADHGDHTASHTQEHHARQARSLAYAREVQRSLPAEDRIDFHRILLSLVAAHVDDFTWRRWVDVAETVALEPHEH